MPTDQITEQDRKKAEQCLNCPVCRRARRKQKGLCFWFVKKLEAGVCPACRAYEKVYGRKAHEPIPAAKAQPVGLLTSPQRKAQP